MSGMKLLIRLPRSSCEADLKGGKRLEREGLESTELKGSPKFSTTLESGRVSWLAKYPVD